MEDGGWVAAVLQDWRAAALPRRLAAAMAFLEKLTLAPGAVEASDLDPLRVSGCSDADLEDLVQICANLNVINRVGAALGFEVSPPRSLARYARLLTTFGYS